MKVLSKLISRLRGPPAAGAPPADGRFVFFDSGFHGDQHLIAVAGHFLAEAEAFVETGANVGSTLAFVARGYPGLVAYSCEPDPEACAHAEAHIAALANAECRNRTSPEFLHELVAEHPDLAERKVVFWLDAHGYGFDWPLRDEVAFVTGRFSDFTLMIDDFRVPGRDDFKWDSYDGQECSLDYIRRSLAPGRDYRLSYPAYRERTSSHHPLTGWGLIQDAGSPPLPEALRRLTSESTIAAED